MHGPNLAVKLGLAAIPDFMLAAIVASMWSILSGWAAAIIIGLGVPLFILTLTAQSDQMHPYAGALRALASLLLITGAGVIIGTAVVAARVPGTLNEYIRASVVAEAKAMPSQLVVVRGEVPPNINGMETWGGIVTNAAADRGSRRRGRRYDEGDVYLIPTHVWAERLFVACGWAANAVGGILGAMCFFLSLGVVALDAVAEGMRGNAGTQS